MEIKVVSNSVIDTNKLSNLVASKLLGGDVVLLTGDLGAGKTTFVKGIGKALGIKEDIVSPTFNILKCYFNVTPNLFHIDAYRLEDTNKDIGLEEFIESDGITMIEWPIYIKELIPEVHLEISIKNIGGNNREFTFESESEHFFQLINYVKENY